MSTSTKSPVTTSVTIETDVKQSTDDIANLADNRDKPFIIILSVTLPTLALIAILIALILCYRRRHATLWLQKIGNSRSIMLNVNDRDHQKIIKLFSISFLDHTNRLQAIVVNLSSSSVQPQ